MEAADDATWFREQLVELGDDRLIETIDRAVRRNAGVDRGIAPTKTAGLTGTTTRHPGYMKISDDC